MARLGVPLEFARCPEIEEEIAMLNRTYRDEETFGENSAATPQES